VKTLLATTAALLALDAPAQAESLATCFQRENIQQRTAELQRSNSVLKLRNEWASEVGRLETELLNARIVGSDTTKLEIQIAIAKDRAESATRKLQIEADSADRMAYLAPSGCY